MDKPELVLPFTFQVGLAALLVLAWRGVVLGWRNGYWEVVCLLKQINLSSTPTHSLADLARRGGGARGVVGRLCAYILGHFSTSR